MTKTLKHFQRIILVSIQWIDMWLKQTPGGNLAKCCSSGDDLAPVCLHDRIYLIYLQRGFPGGTVVKNSPANARKVHLIPASGRSPGEENGNHSSILTWKISWTEEPGRLQTMRVSKSQTQLNTHTHMHRLSLSALKSSKEPLSLMRGLGRSQGKQAPPVPWQKWGQWLEGGEGAH